MVEFDVEVHSPVVAPAVCRRTQERHAALGRVVTQDELILHVAEHKRNGQHVVFTNGCFDLLHPGHIRGFEQARALGDVLIVAINSDSSVKFLKGADRPIIPQDERAEILAALAAVDYVVVFDELTPREIVARVLPDVLVKGGDWGENEIVGREEVEAAGGRVVSIPLEPGYSTTAIIEKIRLARPQSPPSPK
jgi:D-beta-D-heptose 7-phosphate kinase/D-beta-D-heptose 1-phosphate adenosyltransferase